MNASFRPSFAARSRNVVLALLATTAWIPSANAQESEPAAAGPDAVTPAQEPAAPTPEREAPTPTPAPVPAVVPEPALAPAPAPAPEQPAKSLLKLTPMGYVEAYYSYNFNRPANGITNFRGFDNRHNTISLTNAVVGVQADVGPVTTRLILQYGATGSTYYAGEPTFPGAAGANGSSGELWKYLQEANIAWKAPVGRGLTLQAGLVPSPIGVESFAVKDNAHFSRSNLFFGFPFYHTGVRATYEWTERVSTTVSLFNGWNNVVDNNSQKSVQASVSYKVPNKLTAQALYFGGTERSRGAAEGPWWRHHFNAYAQYYVTPRVALTAQGDGGFEVNRFGTAAWAAGALYARVEATPWLFVALRGDRFHEHLASDSRGQVSSPIFWNGSKWVSSLTATLETKPHENLSVRLEFRHDQSQSPLFFSRSALGDGSAAAPYIANAKAQNTLLLGATAWF